MHNYLVTQEIEGINDTPGNSLQHRYKHSPEPTNNKTHMLMTQTNNKRTLRNHIVSYIKNTCTHHPNTNEY